MSAKESAASRFKVHARRIEDLASLVDDLQLQLTTLKQRFDRLRDDHSDQLASLRGRITANERWADKKKTQDQLIPATPEEILEALPEADRRLMRALLARGSADQPSEPKTTGG